MMRVNFDKAEAQRFLEAIRLNAYPSGMPDGPVKLVWLMTWFVWRGVLLYAIAYALYAADSGRTRSKMPEEFRDDPRGEHLQRDITAAVEFNAYLAGLVANDEFDALHESPFIAGIKDRADGRKIYPLRGV